MPSILDLVLSILVIGAGASLALQQVLNANLRTALFSPWWAGFVSYAVGTLAMLVLASFAPGPPLSASSLSRASWTAWTGGFFGAIFITTAILTVPRLGVATVLALVVLGQMLGALTFDQFGLLGLQQHPTTLVRLAGVALLIMGVILVRL